MFFTTNPPPAARCEKETQSTHEEMIGRRSSFVTLWRDTSTFCCNTEAVPDAVRMIGAEPHCHTAPWS